MNNAVFGKAMEKVRKHRDIKVVRAESRRNYLLIIEMKKRKTPILMYKPVYIGLSIKELGEILMYEFCYDYVKPKYAEKAKLCYNDPYISLHK